MDRRAAYPGVVTTAYRADHVGSLLRPPRLLEAREANAGGRLPDADLRREEDAAILEVLSRQRDAGLRVFTDGELRRASWVTGLAAAVDGFVPRSRVVDWHGPGGGPEASTARVVGARLEPRRRLAGDEAAFLLRHSPGACKVTLPAPSNFFVAGWQPGVTDAVYGSRGELLDDVTRIVRAEVEALIADGVAYVQLDAPYYCPFVDEGQRERMRADGTDPDAALRQMVEADAACVAGLAREGLTLGLHVCRGNSRSRWLAEGAFDPIAEPLLGTVPVDAFLLEYDAPRHGGFEPLRFLPAGRSAVLGLVTTKAPDLEPREELRRRIDEAARHAPLERLALSPQCGFASVAAGNLLTEDDQWRKLELVVDTARAVWGEA
jgi:5-methyltetrahydropteroyltriglutamate--homocysteine methyltransferase